MTVWTRFKRYMQWVTASYEATSHRTLVDPKDGVEYEHVVIVRGHERFDLYQRKDSEYMYKGWFFDTGKPAYITGEHEAIVRCAGDRCARDVRICKEAALRKVVSRLQVA